LGVPLQVLPSLPQTSLRVQALPSLHGVPGAGLLWQAPPLQASAVQVWPSLQAALLLTLLQAPLAAIQLSSVQTLPSSQLTVALPAQTPAALQASPEVQALPSLHGVPLCGAPKQAPLRLSQMSRVHGLLSLQTLATPLHLAPAQVSAVVQALPSLHGPPAATP
jgi:hypothetical protein